MGSAFILVWIMLWALSFGAAFLAGDRTGRKYDALMLTGILGLLGLLVFGLTLALDGRDGRTGERLR